MDRPVKTYCGGVPYYVDTVDSLRKELKAAKENAEFHFANYEALQQQLASYIKEDEIKANVNKLLVEQLAECQAMYLDLEDVYRHSVDDENALNQQLAECQALNEKLTARLRWHIRVYRVADEAWSPEADCDRLMAKELE